MPYRICFGGTTSSHQIIENRLDHRDFEPGYGVSSQADFYAYDAFVPLTAADYAELRHVAGIEAKSILPNREVAALCDDKRKLDKALHELGFSELSPGVASDSNDRFPYVAKTTHGEMGSGTVIIQSCDEELTQAEFLKRSDVIRQNYIAGNIEYSAHFLVHKGKIRFQRTIKHEMPGSPVVRGYHGLPRRSRPLPHIDPFADRFTAVLLALGYEGQVIIDYKITNGGPKILEMNTSMGESLLRLINEWLDAYLVTLGIAYPRSKLSRLFHSKRRISARRLRRMFRFQQPGRLIPPAVGHD